MVTWGTNTTTVFGAGSAAAPTTPAPSTTGFTFGGGTPSTPPAASTPAPSNPPPLFSTAATATITAPAPTASVFGQLAPTPAAGGLFGSTPAPAPTGGLFGSTHTSVPTGGLFGSTTAPAPSGGLFGSTPASAPTGGLFGSSSAPPPAAGGLFGASTSTYGASPAPSTFGGFGTQQPQQQANPQQAALHAHQSASQRQEAARIEEAILALHSKYSPNAADPLNPALTSNNTPNSLCAFTAILYDSLPPEHRTQGHLSVPKPPSVSNPVWNEALARNPDPKDLAPVPLVGASTLHSRIVSQQEKANALAAHANKLRETLQFLERAARSSKDAIKHSNLEQEELRRRLLEIMRKVEIIRCMGQPTQSAEMKAHQRLGDIMKQVNMVGKLLADLEEKGRHQARAWRMRGATLESQQHSEFGLVPLQEEDKVALFHVLNDQRLGMEQLGLIVKRDVRDAEILKKELINSTGRSKTLLPSGVAIFGGP